MLEFHLTLSDAVHGGILAALRRDHKAALACVELLERQLGEAGAVSGDIALIPKLLDQLIDSPDDFHHVTERRLYRRLWFRMGLFLPRYFDLDELHDGRRDRRIDVMCFLGDDASIFVENARAREALAAFCACVREQTEIEERCFLPLLKRYLTSDDWSLAEDEAEAYFAAWSSIRGYDTCNPPV